MKETTYFITFMNNLTKDHKIKTFFPKKINHEIRSR